MKNNIPTHINTHSPTSSVSSMKIEKRTKKIFNKVEEIKKTETKKIHQKLQAHLHIIN